MLLIILPRDHGTNCTLLYIPKIYIMSYSGHIIHGYHEYMRMLVLYQLVILDMDFNQISNSWLSNSIYLYQHQITAVYIKNSLYQPQFTFFLWITFESHPLCPCVSPARHQPLVRQVQSPEMVETVRSASSGGARSGEGISDRRGTATMVRKGSFKGRYNVIPDDTMWYHDLVGVLVGDLLILTVT